MAVEGDLWKDCLREEREIPDYSVRKTTERDQWTQKQILFCSILPGLC